MRTFDGWRGAVYSHAVTVANDKECHVCLMRTWEEFSAFLDALALAYGISEDRRVILWVANLSFEFSFLARRFEWGDFFAKEERQPLLATLKDGIELRECLTISGGNLAHLAKTYCYTQKLVGDLDYKKPRNTATPLDSKELAYIVNDVVILSEFAKYVFQTHIVKKHKVPMTKTSILLDELKKEFKTESKILDTFKAHESVYLSHIQKCYPDETTYYAWFRYLFRGGYVHSNALYSNIDLSLVDMYDITSSYPYEMLTGYVPITPFESVPYDGRFLKSKCCIMWCEFSNIRLKPGNTMTIESKNKIIESDNASYDNGRLISADAIRVALTELDYLTYQEYYAWDSMTVTHFEVADRGKMPGFFRRLVQDYYVIKSRLKSEGQKESMKYKLAKESVNSFYGATVKRIRLDTITYADGWTRTKNDKDYDKEKSGAILLPQWGIWITAQARRSLLSTVSTLQSSGVKVVYCDTDSIKYIANDKGASIMSRINAKRTKRLLHRGYRSIWLADLGRFDRENVRPVRFKTLGAKRYLCYDGKELQATVAGMPKKSINALGADVDAVFDAFSDYGFALDDKQSGKLTASYTDDSYQLYVDGEWMVEKSGCALYEIPFSMRVKPDYHDYMTRLQEMARVGYS